VVQKGSALEQAKQHGHADSNRQPKSDLEGSTKRKLAASLPGVVRRSGGDERDERDGPNDGKRQKIDDSALGKTVSDGMTDQTAAKAFPLAEKNRSKASVLLDIIDLVDLDDGPVKSVGAPCQSKMPHSLSDWFRKAPVK